MGYTLKETLHYTKEDAKKAQAEKGVPGYSEVYPKGVFPCKVKNPGTNEVVDGWKSVVEVFSG